MTMTPNFQTEILNMSLILAPLGVPINMMATQTKILNVPMLLWSRYFQHSGAISTDDTSSQHNAEMSLCCEVISSSVIFAVLVLRLCCRHPYKMF